MQLTDEQKQQVAQWIAGGLKLSAVQDRLEKEFGVRLTYMETRFLMDDLQVTPQDAPEPAHRARGGYSGGGGRAAAGRQPDWPQAAPGMCG